jgi:hypothetical protein
MMCGVEILRHSLQEVLQAKERACVWHFPVEMICEEGMTK